MCEFRREEDKDRDEVYRIHQDAFQRTDEAELVEKLRRNKQFNPNLSFIALVNKKIVGHILFTPILINSKSYSSLALAPLSILSEYQRQGIGSQLMEYALNEVKAQDFSVIIVLGHEHFYPRFGFLPAKKFRIQPPFPLENKDCFMVLELKPQALLIDDQEGVVQYLPEFGL
jgi:predicted N-acetyltransferase YhbS